jgi:Tol biopolymer transport system component
MGEVYRARDTRLGREVAIKVLPDSLGSDPERLKRFEREARSASALNHPNIVTIHDIGSSGAVSYIAMELVQGESLRVALSGGALPTKRLLQIGTQIAEGLAKAHAAGIVHRDLKPENVMVTEDGLVKILDFGLAKLTQPDSSGGTATMSPTVSGATQEGIILGTVGYMSPEQAVGGSIDYRSDQFSFGSILYEMATGRRAFQRGSAPQTLAAIIQEEPEPIAAINAKVPGPVRWIVERCLSKEVRRRFASTDDLASDLATVLDHLSEATSTVEAVPAVTGRVRGRRRWLQVAIAGGLLLALGIVGWRLRLTDYFWKNPLAGAHYTRFTDWVGSELDAAISADGKFVAFVSDRAGPFDAWVGQVGGGEFLNLTNGQYPALVTGTSCAVGFADDGAHVWLFVTRDAKSFGIWLMPTMGGALRPFLTAVGVAWSPDRNQIVYHTGDSGDPIFIADRNGANPRQVVAPAGPGIHNHYPTWSPDGHFVYFVRGIPPDDMDIWRVPSAGGVAERLTHHNSLVAYPTVLDERTLIYTATRDDGSGSGLFALDVERRIAHAVSSGLEEYMSVAASADGRRLVATVANPVRDLWTVPISDHILGDPGANRLTLPTVRASAPRFGPDYIVYRSSRGGADGLWKFKDGIETELWRGSEGAVAAAPAVSFDGTQICFSVRHGMRTQLYLIAADGSNARRFAESLDVRGAPSWSPDGKWIAVVANEDKTYPLFKVPVDGGPPVRLVEGVISNPVWSPDGGFILYSEGRSGGILQLNGVTPDKRAVPQPQLPGVSYAGNRYRFLPDGKSLVVALGLYWRQNFELVDLMTGQRRKLTDFGPGYDMKSFDVSPDGRQILFDRYRQNSDIVLIDLPPR